ncbi:MAG TPA: tyrosine--tRNA ligase [Solirubrobacteraceae bacterium]|nr:tyrosine--tRNA ligase [Solirubrobacteraceae bacterium]
MPQVPFEAEELARDAVDCLPVGELARLLAIGRPLRVKLGIDPTAPDIHLGHTVVLTKLRAFQDAGHTVVLIIGDYTARVGDPSGRSSTRPQLSDEQIDANARTFQEQAFKVLDPGRVEVRHNSEWLDMTMGDLFALLRTTTVGALLERDDFAKRRAAQTPISMLEMLYPLMQAYDSVAVRADVELGGTDQKFNLLLGRDVQRAYGMPEQAILTMPILVGTEGRLKMSKSLGNQIGVTDPPGEIYGKTMSVPDTALDQYYRLLLGRPPPADLGSRDAKRLLARELVTRFHSADDAERAEAEFDLIARGGEPDRIDELRVVPAADGLVHLPGVIADGFGKSRSEARRLLAQGGVHLDGRVIDEIDVAGRRLDGRVLRVGKRHFRRLAVAR